MSEKHRDPRAVADDPDEFFGAECLSTEEIIGFVRETLSVEEQARVEDHIDWCALCAAELAAHYDDETPALVAQFWASVREVRIAIPEELLPAGAMGLAAEAAPATDGSTSDGHVRWRASPWGETLHVEITTGWRELAGLRLAVTVDGVPISGTTELPHLDLVPTREGLKAELFLRREYLAARSADLATPVVAWELGFAPPAS